MKVGERFHLLIHTPNGCNCCDWSRLKPGACNSICVSCGSGRGPRSGAIVHCFPSALSETWIISGASDTQSGTLRACWNHKVAAWPNILLQSQSPARISTLIAQDFVTWTDFSFMQFKAIHVNPFGFLSIWKHVCTFSCLIIVLGKGKSCCS